MIIPTNSDLANGELSIEELEAIAAGWPSWARAIGRGIETVGHDLGKVLDVAGKGLYLAWVGYTGYIIGYAAINGKAPN